MAVIMDLSMSWIILCCVTAVSVVLFVFICVCCRSRKKSNQAYVMDANEVSRRTELANNNVPQILAQNKQRYFLHGVTYSSINSNDEFSGASHAANDNNHAEQFSFNILSIFKNIQRSKYSDSTSEIGKVLGDNLEDSHMDSMHKNFEKSVLCLQWNDSANASRSADRDETFSCLSTESKGTFISVLPAYNRSHSLAETYKSTLSDK